MKKIIEKLIREAFSKSGIAAPEFFSVGRPPKIGAGDYATNAAMVAAKSAKEPPMAIAEKLAAELSQSGDAIASATAAAPGFVNIKLTDRAILAMLADALGSEDYGHGQVGVGSRVLLEYYQPNIAKPLHLGHLRTAIIGDALFRILKSQGYAVESDSHLGDWGTQFGLLLHAYKQWGDDEVIARDPISELNKLYVRVNAEADADPAVRDAGKSEFVRLERGDAVNRQLWEKFAAWSMQEFEFVYEVLGVRRADHNWGESFYEDKMPAVLEELSEKGLLAESQGAKIVNLEPEGLGVAILVKSDGGTTYLLRDLATFIYRKQQGFDRQLYVVDVRQRHTFAQTFAILKKLGRLAEGEAEHVSYGFLTLPEGIFSTRKGNAIGPRELVRRTEEKVSAIIAEKNPDLPDPDRVARQVAVGAIKYFDLKHNLHSDIVFRWEEVLDFEGNSGPYIQYAHARIRSILRKAGTRQTAHPVALSGDAERSLAVRLVYFPDAVALAADELMPHHLADYLYSLAAEFNVFYQRARVIDEPDEAIRALRLALVEAVANTLKLGMDFLGIEAPEEM